MDLFNWLKRAPPPPQGLSLVTEAALSVLSARVEAAEKALKDVQLMRLEWAEVLDKLTAWTNRQSARDAKRIRAGLTELTEDPPEPTNGDPAESDATNPAFARRQAKAALRQRIGGVVR